MLINSSKRVTFLPFPNLPSDSLESKSEISSAEDPQVSYERAVQIMKDSCSIRLSNRLCAVTCVLSSFCGVWTNIHLIVSDSKRSDRSLNGEVIISAVAATIVFFQVVVALNGVKNKIKEQRLYNGGPCSIALPSVFLIVAICALILKSDKVMDVNVRYLLFSYSSSAVSVCSSLGLEKISADPLAIKLLKVEEKIPCTEIEMQTLL